VGANLNTLPLVGDIAKWLGCRSWLADIPWSAPIYGLQVTTL